MPFSQAKVYVGLGIIVRKQIYICCYRNKQTGNFWLERESGKGCRMMGELSMIRLCWEEGERLFHSPFFFPLSEKKQKRVNGECFSLLMVLGHSTYSTQSFA